MLSYYCNIKVIRYIMLGNINFLLINVIIYNFVWKKLISKIFIGIKKNRGEKYKRWFMVISLI